MESLKLILILLVIVVILALYTMNTAIWPYSSGFQVKTETSFRKDLKKFQMGTGALVTNFNSISLN